MLHGQCEGRVVRKLAFCICENKDAHLMSVFVFATPIVQSPFFFNLKFLACFCDCIVRFVSDLVGLLSFSCEVTLMYFARGGRALLGQEGDLGVSVGGTVWLDDISCQGKETSILDCSHRPVGENNCDHSEDVAVLCFPGRTKYGFK